MSDEVQEYDDPYKEKLNYTHQIRRKMVQALGGEDDKDKINTDPKNMSVLAGLLKDMDSATINDRKVNVDEKNANSSKMVAEAAAQMLDQAQNQNPFERDPNLVPAPQTENPDLIGEYEYVEGEGEIGVITETAEEFAKRMGEELSEEEREEETADDDHRPLEPPI